MTTLVWNCRGLGNPRTIRELRSLIKTTNPQMVGLIETKSSKEKMELLRVQLGFFGCFSVPAKGSAGGLALLWKQEAEVSIRSFSFYHIDFLVSDADPVRHTLFYGSPVASKRMLSWNLLRSLYENSQLPWCILGDFNDILCKSDTTRFSNQKGYYMHLFRRAIIDCSLMDFGYKGYKFTYTNRRQGSLECKSRLDRVFASTGWLSKFSTATNSHIYTYSSDHMALLLEVRGRKVGCSNVFRFENMWLQDSKFKQVVQQVWQQCSKRRLSYEDKLQILQKDLSQWNKHHFGNVQYKIKKIKSELEDFNTQERSDFTQHKEEQLISELDDWLQKEEILWRQRSRVAWLSEGDNNTKYFHAVANARRKSNSISKLKDHSGEEVTDGQRIKQLIVQHYTSIFQQSRPISKEVLQSNLSCLDRKITEHQNTILSAPYTVEEVTQAVFQIHPMKAPGKDGFSADFFQSCWNIVRDDFVKECLSFLNNGILNSEANTTLITLIPKVKNASTVTDYRPISLIGTKMKVISKMIVNRLQQILADVISIEQSAFVKNRVITDNLIISHEIIHYIKKVRNQKSVYGSLKLDITKAYDSVDWLFLQEVLSKMGFTDVWIQRIMQLVTSVKYFIKVNDVFTDEIVPRRGLRQGDPLSPYLFILCTEFFSALLTQYKNMGLIDGIKIARRAPPISHLLFADDSMLFLEISHNSISRVRHLLDIYGDTSGLRVNFSKSEMLVSRNICPTLTDHIHHELGIKIVDNHSKYLGLPTALNRKYSQTFQPILDRIWSKTRSWNSQTLSQGGRHVLIQSVLNAIPQYWLSCFILPDVVIKKLHSIINDFWWKHAGKDKPMYWIRGSIARQPKGDGGLGFYNFHFLNMAFLAKQCWRIMKEHNPLLSKLIKSKYYPNCHMLDAPISAQPSHVWRAFHRSLAILRHGCVTDQMTGDVRWSLNSQEVLDIHSSYKAMQHISLSHSNLASEGEQSDKSSLAKFWKFVWKLPVPRKIKIFIWPGYHKGLPTNQQLVTRHISSIKPCSICNYHREGDLHPFIHCRWCKSVWSSLEQNVHNDCKDFTSLADVFFFLYSQVSPDVFCKTIIAFWFIWYHRNRVMHGGSILSPVAASNRIVKLYKDFTRNNKALLSNISSTALVWQCPTGIFVKVNCDGSWFEEQKSGGLGVIVRYSHGCVLAIAAKYMEQSNNVLECEVEALLLGFYHSQKSTTSACCL
ncbi:hypothetical protein QQ045_031114 [Rhodiola kirilowii]